MEITCIDLAELKIQMFYRLSATILLGNALFQHMSIFLFNASSNVGIVIVTCAFKLHANKTYFRQAGADMSISKSHTTTQINHLLDKPHAMFVGGVSCIGESG